MLETAWESRWVPDPLCKIPERVINRTDMSQWVEGKAKPAKTDVLTSSSRELLLKLVFTSDQSFGDIRRPDD